jgi:hypothetical protein
MFHKHKRMADGHLNKCKACVVLSVKEWRNKNPGCRQTEYMNNLGKIRRLRGLKRNPNGIGSDPVKRKLTASKWANKRKRIQKAFTDDLTLLVETEAFLLAPCRTKLTGIKWSVDHTIPIMYKDCCGLHSADNLQVVPAKWNSEKGNRHAEPFWP